MDLQHNKMITSEDIYVDLCLKIEKLEYMPGTRLSENELCKCYGVTRHVVRNALTSLKQRRLVEVYPQRGTYVSLIDMKYIGDILYLRESVEQEALCRIMEMEDRSEVVGRLRQALEAQRNLPRGINYSDEFYAIDNIFHESLLDAIDKPNVTKLISDPYIHIRRWRNFEIRTEARMQEIMEEHEKIIQAIEAGDAKMGREWLHLHLDTVGRYFKPLKEQEAQYFVAE